MILKACASLYTDNNLVEKEIRTAISFLIFFFLPKENYLWENITKKIKELYNENFIFPSLGDSSVHPWTPFVT